MTIKILT